MTERKKMLAGIPYCSADAELRAQGTKASALTKEYNSLGADNEAGKKEILHKLFGFCGKDVRVNQPIHVDYGCNIHIGDNSLINKNCTLLDTNIIKIGSRVLIAPDVKIYTACHSADKNERFKEIDGKLKIITFTKPVEIGDDTWIGGGSIILPGVKIGSNVIIGAGSVVTKDIPDNVVAVGNPCNIVRENTPPQE